MSNSQKSKRVGPKIEQKLTLTRKEYIYLQVLEAPIYFLSQKYETKEKLISEADYYASPRNLHEELEMLIPFLGLPEEEEHIAEYVVYNIDSKGKLRINANELAERFNISIEKAQKIIDTIYEAFSEEIQQLSSERENDYILPDVTITESEIIVKRIEVKDPIISKALQMREETLRKICEIVKSVNEPFFKGYRKYPQILTMRYVSKLLGLNISTISRAVRNKYVNTPRGVLPLRIFFGRILNPQLIINEINELLKIDSNLTDKQLSILLKSTGINISRRTVNKYRRLSKLKGEE
ncbi:MAG: RNA polymerase subunit sigma-54 [Fervidobacterium sp.]|jgi:RNA polymerase sigma-54 factor